MLTRTRVTLSAPLVFLLFCIWIAPIGPASASAQTRTRRTATTRVRTPYAQGYSRGYSNGYLAGQSDWKRGTPRDFQHSAQAAGQSANDGSSAPRRYRGRYRLGLELGYTDGYYGRARNAVLPPNAEQERANLARAASIDQSNPGAGPPDSSSPRSDTGQGRRGGNYRPSYGVPADTELRLKLNSPID